MGAAVTGTRKTLTSLEETRSCALSWVQSVDDQHILLLSGQMGAGKTQFCQYVLQAYGVSDVSSPTFNLIHSYHTPAKTIHHLDLYRLESEEELEFIGLWDLLSAPALILIEWGDKMDIHGLQFADWTLERLNISVLPGGRREFHFQKVS